MKKIKKNFEINTIDKDVLGETLIISALYAKDICNYIDMAADHKTTSIMCEPYVTTEELCNDIINDIYMKGKIINLRNTFISWYRGLERTQKDMCKNYFLHITNHKLPAEAKLPTRRNILPIIHSFILTYDLATWFDRFDLIKYPVIYGLYTERLHSVQITNNKKGRRRK